MGEQWATQAMRPSSSTAMPSTRCRTKSGTRVHRRTCCTYSPRAWSANSLLWVCTVDYLDSFGGKSRFVLMGHSVGAYISLQVTHAHAHAHAHAHTTAARTRTTLTLIAIGRTATGDQATSRLPHSQGHQPVPHGEGPLPGSPAPGQGKQAGGRRVAIDRS